MAAASTTTKMLQPYLTAARMLEEDGFASHYEVWKAYESTKGPDAPSMQESIDPGVLECRHVVAASQH